MASLAQPGLVKRFISSTLRVFFKLLYHQFAWAYDWVADLVSIGRWKSWIYAVLPYLGNSKVLELGCGPGHLQVAQSPECGSIFGLDASSQMVRLAGQRLINHKRIKNLVLGKTQNLPYRDQSFPRIVTTFPSEYINDLETLGQAWRVLEDTGELIIMPAAWITGENLLDKFAAWVFSTTGQALDLDIDNLEERFADLIDGLKETGFRVRCNLIELSSSKIFLIRAIKDASIGS